MVITAGEEISVSIYDRCDRTRVEGSRVLMKRVAGTDLTTTEEAQSVRNEDGERITGDLA